MNKYFKLSRGGWGYNSGDIAKAIEKTGNGYVVFVPNRNSTSYYSPNVHFGLTSLIPSTKEEFEAQNKPKETMQKVTTTINKLTYTGNIDIPRGTTFEVIKEFPNSYQVINPNSKEFILKDKYLFLHKYYFESQEPEFVLPKKYCVRHHKEVVNYIFKLENIKSGFSQHLALFSHFPKSDSKYCFRQIQSGYTEITIEQFKKYVLKEEPKEESPRKIEVKLDSRVYSLDEISKVINANYEKEDALEIIKTIKSIK